MTSDTGAGDDDEIGADHDTEDDAAEEILRARREPSFIDRSEPVTPAWVLHPEVKNARGQRASEPALA